MGAEVVDVVTDGLEVGDDGVFQFEGAVIGSDGDAEGGVAHGRGRDSRPGNPDWKPEISAIA